MTVLHDTELDALFHDILGSSCSDHISAPNNTLTLRAISTPSHPDPARRYLSARLVSRARLSRPRGSLIATLTLPCASGIWPAFWLLPFEPFTWPHDGEIDIAETWNGDQQNHSCLHWGFYSPEDRAKHRAIGSHVQNMANRPVRFEFAWWQDEATRGGQLMWWIDGAPVMRAEIPKDMRREMKDFVVLLNIAMGGNVCAGKLPGLGSYEMIVHEMKMCEEPEGGWGRFEGDWQRTREGNMVG
jgi:beta-glucanase (GH16 family)